MVSGIFERAEEIGDFMKNLDLLPPFNPALLDVVFGNFNPNGKLPVEMPSSMEAVRNQKEDVPYDSKDPLYKFGYGLSY